MAKIYTALGLMSGTSMDGVDASIIQTNGKSEYKVILDKYFEYPKNIYNDLTTLRDKIKNSKDLKKHQKKIKSIEKDITIFHAESVKKILKKTQLNVDFIGFHGQTIFHNSGEGVSKQLGDGKLLSKLTKKKVVYDFRQNDLKNSGMGAPLAPIFHQLLYKKLKRKIGGVSVDFLNIGGIINSTNFWHGYEDQIIEAKDIGPGMCLIDKLIRDNIDQRYDKNGLIAKSGNINKAKLKKLLKNLDKNVDGKEIHNLENLSEKERLAWLTNYNGRVSPSLDIKQFDYKIVEKLSLKDAAATLIEFIALTIERQGYYKGCCIILCGGGRKNNFLIKRIKKINKICKIKLIDDYGIDGDFIESQAFAYLAIRSYLGLPISYPETTGCIKPCTGGVIVKSY
jgi:anhydro-N-acetylmuramic acid kinase